MADRYDKSFTRKSTAPDPAAPMQPDDPLAELARIVSGNQSFDDLVGRQASQRPVSQPQVSQRPAAAPPPPPAQAPAARPSVRDFSFDLESELLNDLQSSFDPAARAAPPRMEPPPVARPAQPAREAYPPPHQRQEPAPPSWTAPREPVEEDPYSGTAYAAGEHERPQAAPDPLAASRVFGRSRTAPPPVEEPPMAAYEDDGYYDEDAEPQYDDGDYGDDRFTEYDGYDAEPTRRSRRPLIIAAIVLAVALAGGLGVLAFKDRGTSGDSGAPKVIAADPGPTKVEPAAPPVEQDGQQNKLIYDRANPDSAPEEQLVLPDDGAMDAAPASNESVGSREISRIILPGAPGDGSAPAGSDTAAPAAGDDASGDAVPRKVRTVVIRPDGTIVSSEARAKDAAPAADGATAPAADASSDAAPPALSAPPPEASSASGQVADAAPPAADNGNPAQALGPTVGPDPVPIDTETVAVNPPAAPPQKDASQLEPPKPAPAKPAARTTPATASSGGGGFMVQVTAQRSEAQALSAFQGLQRSYPSILGGRTPDIMRVDLGAKGIYYRARVGPMASRDEAISLCGALKAAGGDCIVAKN